MPETCLDCDFLFNLGICEMGVKHYLCAAHGFVRSRFNSGEYARPDWCPLITEHELLKQVVSPFNKWEETETWEIGE